MTTEEFVQMLRDIQWLTVKLRGKPLTEEEIEQMAEEHKKIKSGEISLSDEGWLL